MKAALKGSTSLTPVDPLKADFRNFLWAVWKHLGLPDPTPVQYDIAQFLQHGPKRLVVQAFRGVGKSWITTAFVLWLLYCNPQIKVLVVSANEDKAREFSTFALRLIHDMPLLTHLIPGPEQRQSMLSFDVGPSKPDIAPSLKCVGITGQLTGSRAHVIVADDIEVPKNSDTQVKRDKLLELIKEFDAVLKPADEMVTQDRRIIYLGTPQTEQTIYNVLPDRGYVIRIWPARYPGKLDKYGNRLAPSLAMALSRDAELVGKPTDSARFHEEDLTERELSYGRSGFALQFQLDTSLSDAEKHPLKLSDLLVYPCDPYRAPIDFMWASSPELTVKELPTIGLLGDRYHRPAWCSGDVAEYEASIMFVDPSGRGKDETAFAVLKLLHGRIFLVASGGYLGGYDDETLKALMMTAKRHEVKKILVEPNFGGGMFTHLLKSAAQKYYLCGVEDAEWQSTMKEQRIVDTLEPVMNQHRLVVCPSVVEADYESVLQRNDTGDKGPLYRLFYQMTRMTRQKGALAQDDRLDALAGGVAYFTAHLARDTDRAVTEHKEGLLDDELEKFIEGALGLKGGNPPPRRMASSVGRVAQKRS